MHAEFQPTVYILANRRNETLYIGVTSDLCSRIAQHKEGNIPGFTKKYDIKTLVWFQYFDAMADAILREKQMKEWKCEWKIELIASSNPAWRDLYAETCGVYLP